MKPMHQIFGALFFFVALWYSSLGPSPDLTMITADPKLRTKNPAETSNPRIFWGFHKLSPDIRMDDEELESHGFELIPREDFKPSEKNLRLRPSPDSRPLSPHPSEQMHRDKWVDVWGKVLNGKR